MKVGDTILKINGADVEDAPGAARLLAGGEGRRVRLLISRGGELISLWVTPRYSPQDKAYRIGLYLRDTAAGVGTLTFYDPGSNQYGALGHVILDSDTHQPINLSEGSIVKAKIIGIKAAQRGRPGEKTGIFVEDSFGSISKNTPYGIFGSISDPARVDTPCRDALPMALSTEAQTGPAPRCGEDCRRGAGGGGAASPGGRRQAPCLAPGLLPAPAGAGGDAPGRYARGTLVQPA